MSVLQPGTKVGPYTLLRPLGHGGMSEVHLGQLPDGTLHAVKILLSNSDQSSLARFEREIGSMQAANNKYIAKLCDYDLRSSPAWLSCEYIQGMTLAEAIKLATFNEQQLSSLALGVATAIEEFNKAGIVHRDIKANNIMITIDGTIKVIDLGIAHDEDMLLPTLTLPGDILGTPGYVSPERLMGEDATPATDIFSLGVLLVEASSRHKPFGAHKHSQQGINNAVVQDQPNFAGVPTTICRQLIEPCLIKDPAKRATINDVMSFLLDPKHNVDPPLGTNWLPAAVRKKLEAMRPSSDPDKTVALDPDKTRLNPTRACTTQHVKLPAKTLNYTRIAPNNQTRPTRELRPRPPRPAPKVKQSKTKSALWWLALAVAILAATLTYPNASERASDLLGSLRGSATSPVQITPNPNPQSVFKINTFVRRAKVLSDGRTINFPEPAQADGKNIQVKVSVSLLKTDNELENGYNIAKHVVMLRSYYNTEGDDDFIKATFVPDKSQTTNAIGTLIYKDILFHNKIPFSFYLDCDVDNSVCCALEHYGEINPR